MMADFETILSLDSLRSIRLISGVNLVAQTTPLLLHGRLVFDF